MEKDAETCQVKPSAYFSKLSKQIQRLLSRSNPGGYAAFTMDVYASIIKGMQEDAMKSLDGVIPAAASNKNNTNLEINTNLTQNTSLYDDQN